jgi:hypothetical protein
VGYFCHVTWAQIQIALERPQEALIFLKPALASAKDHHLMFRTLELTIILALAYEASGNPSLAVAELEKVFRIAESCGYVRIFAENPDINRLLQKVDERNPHDSFAKQLLVRFITSCCGGMCSKRMVSMGMQPRAIMVRGSLSTQRNASSSSEMAMHTGLRLRNG